MLLSLLLLLRLRRRPSENSLESKNKKTAKKSQALNIRVSVTIETEKKRRKKNSFERENMRADGDPTAAAPPTGGKAPAVARLGGPCCHCRVSSSCCWRKGPPEKPVLCNACGSRFLVKANLEG